MSKNGIEFLEEEIRDILDQFTGRKVTKELIQQIKEKVSKHLLTNYKINTDWKKEFDVRYNPKEDTYTIYNIKERKNFV